MSRNMERKLDHKCFICLLKSLLGNMIFLVAIFKENTSMQTPKVSCIYSKFLYSICVEDVLALLV